MSKFLANYANGIGHMLVTIVAMIILGVLLALGKIDLALFASLFSPVVLAWIGPGIATKTVEGAAKLAPEISSPTSRPLVEPQPIVLKEPPKPKEG